MWHKLLVFEHRSHVEVCCDLRTFTCCSYYVLFSLNVLVGLKGMCLVLFMVGGGCFAEYHNLKEYASKEQSSSKTLGLGSSGAQVKKQLIYGCTELVNARQFMAQVASCYS